MAQEVREETARRIAVLLFEGEAALELAIARSASVMSTFAAEREAAGLTVFHGQEALEEAMQATTLLTQARRQMGQVHRKLEATQRQVGLGHTAFGPVGKPEGGDGDVVGRQLREVA